MLLSESPANGYQLMQALEERSGGEWRPSPGSVYPALSQLEDEGLISSVERPEQSGQVYEITDAGRAHVAERGEEKPPWEPENEPAGDNAWHDFKRAMMGTVKAAAQVMHDGDEAKARAAAEILIEARKRLYLLLADDDIR